MRAQLRSINLTTRCRYHIADKLRAPQPIRPRNNHSLRHARVPKQRCLKLPNNPNRYRLQPTIQNVNTRVPYRTANRRRFRVIVIENHDRRPDRSLCRPIEIRDPTPEAAQGKGEPTHEGLAADEHLKILQSFGAVCGERMPECWRGLKDRGASLLDRTRKHFRIFDDLSWSDGETGTADEGEEQFERCNVESDGGDGQEPIMSVKGNLLLHRQ